jgi:hypothetical protein
MTTAAMSAPVSCDLFASELAPGERVEWTGRPNPSVIFHAEDWVLVPFTLLIAGFTVLWTLAAAGVLKGTKLTSGHPHPLVWVYAVACLIAGQFFLWGRFIVAYRQKLRTYYALTDKRAMVVYVVGRRKKVISAYYATLPMIDKRVRGDGIGSIGFGGVIKRLRGRYDPPPPPTFEDVDDVESVYQIVMRLQGKSGD